MKNVPKKRVVLIAMAALVFALAHSQDARSADLAAMDTSGKLNGPFAAVEGHISLFSDIAEASLIAGSFGYGVRGGYRWHSWGVFLIAEHNMWVATEYETNVVQGAYNIGFGASFSYAHGFVRSAVAVGPSILAFDTLLDDAGTTGIYVDLRPVGLRFAVHRYLVIGVDPLNFSVVAPVLDRIPLVMIQYRSMLYLEVAF
ncbi:MAG: hypothetical protein QNJ97_19110 [Myxococcota bacterium]|nr:hypothetical protein [Myxococcota bacterium]